MKVIIFGIGDFAKQLYYYISNDTAFEVAYFCVHQQYYEQSTFLGLEVLTLEQGLKNLSSDEYKFIIGVGYKRLRMRKTIFEQIKAHGFQLMNLVGRHVSLYGEIKGEGNIILSNVVIEPFVEIYNNNIIWSNVTICHDSMIGNHNFIAANSVIGGFSKVKENNFLGFHSTIVDSITIDQEVLIGASSLVLEDPDNFSVYYGTPARKIKEHRERGIEL